MKNLHIIETDPEKYLLKDYSDSSLNGRRSVYVFPDTIAIAEARNVLLKDHEAIDASAFMTLEGFASYIVRELTGEQPILLSDDLKGLLSRHVFREMKGAARNLSEEYSDILMTDYEMLSPLRLRTERKEWIRMLLQRTGAGLNKGRSDFRISVLDEFAALLEERLEMLAEHGIFDRSGLIRKAAELIESGGFSRIDTANFFFLHFADPAVLSFIHSLSGVAEVRFISGSDLAESSSPALSRFSSMDGTVLRKVDDVKNIGASRRSTQIEFFGAPDRRREVIQIARTIRKRISEEGCRESEFKILARNIEDYDTLVKEILEEYGLAAERGKRRVLRDEPAYAKVENFFRCMEEDATKEDFLHIITDADYRRLLSDSRLAKSLERIPSMIGSWRSETFKRNEDDPDGCWSRISELATKLMDRRLKSGVQHSIDEWVGMVREITDRIAMHDPIDTSRLISHLLSAAVSWSSVCDLLGLKKLAFGDFLILFSRLGQTDTGESYSERSGILLTDVGITYFRRAAETFIVGANFEIFPRSAEQNSFLPVNMLDELERCGIEIRRCTKVFDSAERWYYLKARILTDKLTISFIYSPEAAGYGIPSPFLIEEIKRRGIEGDPISIAYGSNLPAGKYLQDTDEELLTYEEISRMLAYRLGRDRQYAETEFFTEMWKKSGRIPFDEFKRRLNRFDSKYLGWNFSSEHISAITSGRALSPTDLNEYTKCPFRFVLTRLMKVSTPHGDFEQIGIGRDIHAILRTFFTTHAVEKFRSMDSVRLKEMIEETVNAYYSAQYREDYLREPVAIIGIDRVKSALFIFLTREMELLRQTGNSIKLMEHSFGSPGKEFRIGGFKFRGIIDRVDLLPQGNEGAILLDYKFTPPGNLKDYFRTDADRPLDFEIPVYSIYLRDELGYRLCAALYYSILKSTRMPDRAGIIVQETAGKLLPDRPQRRNSQLSIITEREFDERMEGFRRSIVALASEIRSNRFPVEPAEKECGKCYFMSICRNWRGLTSDE
jgi:RecB family exonuclease